MRSTGHTAEAIESELELQETYDHMYHLIRREVHNPATAMRLVNKIAEDFGGDYLPKSKVRERIRNAAIVLARRNGVSTADIARTQGVGVSQRQVQRICWGIVPDVSAMSTVTLADLEDVLKLTCLSEVQIDGKKPQGDKTSC